MTAHNITSELGEIYYPHSALVFYKKNEGFYDKFYIEHFDMDTNGMPINAHPLTLRESKKLGKMLDIEQDIENACFIPEGILPNNVLYLNQQGNGQVIWFTKPQKCKLFFIENLSIPKGEAYLPSLVFKATKSELFIYALKGKNRPTPQTKLYYAPFFNIYRNGNICMGTVDVQAEKADSLEEFIALWEEYFFNSYFSHLLDNYNPIKSNIVEFWQNQINTNKPFDTKVLKQNNRRLKDLI